MKTYSTFLTLLPLLPKYNHQSKWNRITPSFLEDRPLYSPSSSRPHYSQISTWVPRRHHLRPSWMRSLSCSSHPVDSSSNLPPAIICSQTWTLDNKMLHSRLSTFPSNNSSQQLKIPPPSTCSMDYLNNSSNSINSRPLSVTFLRSPPSNHLLSNRVTWTYSVSLIRCLGANSSNRCHKRSREMSGQKAADSLTSLISKQAIRSAWKQPRMGSTSVTEAT